MNKLRLGMGPPYAIRATVSASVDLAPATVTVACFEITKAKGQKVEWGVTISAQSSQSISVFYPLQTTDLDQLGVWKVWIKFTVPGGTVRTNVDQFQVIAEDTI